MGIALGGVVIVLGVIAYFAYQYIYQHYIYPREVGNAFAKLLSQMNQVSSNGTTIIATNGVPSNLEYNMTYVIKYTIPPNQVLANEYMIGSLNMSTVYVMQVLLPGSEEYALSSGWADNGFVTIIVPFIGFSMVAEPVNYTNVGGYTWTLYHFNPYCLGNWTFIINPVSMTPLPSNATIDNMQNYAIVDKYFIVIYHNGSLVYEG